MLDILASLFVVSMVLTAFWIIADIAIQEWEGDVYGKHNPWLDCEE